MVRNVEHIVAVDNICAWPSIVRAGDGMIYAAVHNQPSHGKMEGDVDVYASADDGKTWRYRGTPSPHEEDEIRMNHAFGIAADGSLVVLCSGWGGKDYREFILPVMVSRSGDGGATWDRTGTMRLSPGMPALIPFGTIVRTGPSTLSAACYDAVSQQGVNSVYLLTSEDDGSTWANPIPLAITVDGIMEVCNVNETALVATGRNGIVAAARTHTPEARLRLFISGDRGRSWSSPERYLGSGITGPSEHPGNLIRLRNGSLLLTYGIRWGDRGVGARVSNDDGRSWGPPMRVFSYGGQDNGYPSSVELDDGLIVTAFYSNANRLHERYYMGVLRWRIPDNSSGR